MDDFHGKNPAAFFYIRDHSSFKSLLPSEFKYDFETDNFEDVEKLQQLKEKIKHSGYEVMSQYPASFSKIDENGVAILKNLEMFGSRLFDNCWNAILNFHEKNARRVGEHKKRFNTVQTDIGKKQAFKKYDQFTLCTIFTILLTL